MWKEFFYYTRRERISLLVLLVAIACSFAYSAFSPFLKPPSRDSTAIGCGADSAFRAMCDSFFIALREEKNTRKVFKKGEEPKRELFSFDPNTADSIQLIRLGLRPYVASNILRYRRKGGVIRNAAKFASIYGMDSVSVRLLTPCLAIDTTAPIFGKPLRRADSLRATPPLSNKFKDTVVIELNAADTALLRRVPGIGAGFAAKIVGFRQALGGFVSATQLREIPGVGDSLYTQWQPWFMADRSLINRIPVNSAGITRLRNHPYLNFYQAKVIYELRKERGSLHSLRELALLEEFGETDFIRLEPYLDFGEIEKGKQEGR